MNKFADHKMKEVTHIGLFEFDDHLSEGFSDETASVMDVHVFIVSSFFSQNFYFLSKIYISQPFICEKIQPT